MICPFCQHDDTKVIDSRLSTEGTQVKRRRTCSHCQERFTTLEVPHLTMPTVIKRDQRRTPFSQEKLHHGLKKSLEKRPIDADSFDKLIHHCLQKIRQMNDREITTKQIGHIIMEELKKTDKVAYIRFASVYWAFNDLDAYYQCLNHLEKIKEK